MDFNWGNANFTDIQNVIWKVDLFSRLESTVACVSDWQFIELLLLVANVSYHFQNAVKESLNVLEWNYWKNIGMFLAWN